MYWAFRDCTSLTNVPQFPDANTSLVNVAQVCYLNNRMGGVVNTNLWNTNAYPNITSFSLAFRGCTNLSNYSEIPAAWK